MNEEFVLMIEVERRKTAPETWSVVRRHGSFGWDLGFRLPTREKAEELAVAVARITGAKYVGEEK